jgi:hypothetical protein
MQYEQIVGAEASAVLTGSKKPKRAADDAAKGLRRLLEDFGYKK